MLEQNYRYRKAEIDIIAIQDDFIVVVEVKARSSSFFGSPESFVTKKKSDVDYGNRRLHSK
ncbi:YraN family protein [Flavobacteriaceae bacterium]|nr:YraN family protein [Flavobacteriaceae bacterium]